MFEERRDSRSVPVLELLCLEGEVVEGNFDNLKSTLEDGSIGKTLLRSC